MPTPLPTVENLRRANWAQLTPDARLAALQEMENQLAAQENRKACHIEHIPSDVLSENNNAEHLNGRHVLSKPGENREPEPEKIQINPRLLADGESPYAAIETYFHEARHAHQNYVADHPELAESPQQAQDFYKSKHGGYLEHDKDGPVYYRCQPTEMDANHEGQTHTARTYDQLGELDDYLAYQESPAYENKRAEFAIEKVYADDARALVEAKYELVQSQTESSEKTNSGSTSEPSQDQDYSYGYGY